MNGFRDLIAWQKAYSLTTAIYRHTARFPRHERYGLTGQLQRAAVSVAANIAEGYERGHRREYVQFLTIARGSLAEVETYLQLAKDIGYLANEEFAELDGLRIEAGRVLRGLTKSLT